jgi:hypothetical protein
MDHTVLLQLRASTSFLLAAAHSSLAPLETWSVAAAAAAGVDIGEEQCFQTIAHTFLRRFIEYL